jgi:hypothetical protein
MSRMAAAIIQQRKPRPIKPQTMRPADEIGEPEVPGLAANCLWRMKASSAMKATMKETRAATRNIFATASRLYHVCVAESNVKVECVCCLSLLVVYDG